MKDECEVIVVGAGPTGLMLAAELAISGVDVLLVEQRPDQHVDGSRAGGLLPRSLEVLDQRGVVDRFLDAGHTSPVHGFGGIRMTVEDLPTRHNYVLALRQCDFEPLLAEWVVGELAVPIERSCEAVGIVQDDDGVSLAVADGRTFRAPFLVGCDGGRSLVRTSAGVAGVGSDPTRSWIVAECRTAADPKSGQRYTSTGLHGIGRIGADGPVRVVLTERDLRIGKPTIDELREALVSVYGTDFGVHQVGWMSRFTDATRLAATYRERRVLLAGDAAHTHPPQGGQGLNTGLQDAVNLGWKLARVVRGRAADSLLDTYGAERRPVAARVLDNALAQVALTSGGECHQALRGFVAGVAEVDEVRRRTMAMLCALDVRYDLGSDSNGDHPLVGRRMPDLDLVTDDGSTRVFELLRDARPLLVDVTGTSTVDLGPRHGDTVRVVVARHDGGWRIPIVGDVEPAPAVLIRPDGHVAWTGRPTDPELGPTIEHWFDSSPSSLHPAPTSTAQERVR
jgi:3-(3-hydroxy-phenyl)propionate hydroxylase